MSYTWVGLPKAFNGTLPNGGDSNRQNLNQWYQSGDTAFILIASALVLIMVPGLGFLYSGLARRKSALSLIWVCMASTSIITFQWYFWGYSLAFSTHSPNGFIGDLYKFGHANTLGAPSAVGLVPDLLFSFYQMQFCSVTAAIVVGAVAERGRLVPMLVFVFLWATLVYCPIACWAWNPTGWASKWGVLDWAGGGPVEICSGLSALAYSLVLGRRQEHMMLNFRPHNVSLVTLGTVMLWVGWLGFNGGSGGGANLRAAMACWNTNLAAMFAAATWVLLDYRLARKWSMVGWCSGCISGLVAATPASGFITPWGSIILGIVSGVVCNLSTKVKFWLRIDDSLDVFAEHGVGGWLGLIANGLFSAPYIIGLDGVNANPELFPGGWINHNYKQLYKQTAYALAATVWSFGISIILALVVDRIPGLKLRASEEAELLGMDDDQLGEFAYDYVEIRRDYLAWTPAAADQMAHNATIEPESMYGIPEHSEMIAGTALKDASEGGESAPLPEKEKITEKIDRE